MAQPKPGWTATKCRRNPFPARETCGLESSVAQVLVHRQGLFIPPKFWLPPKLIWLVRPTRGSIPDELAVGMKPLPLRRGPPTGLVGSPMPTRPRFVGALTGGGRIPSGVVVGGLGLLSNELLFMHMLTMCSFKSLWIGAEFATDWRQSCKLRYNNVLAVLFR